MSTTEASNDSYCEPLPDANEEFFVLNDFQDTCYTIAMCFCALGVFTTFITFLIFISKKKKNINDLYLIALSLSDLSCNISGVFHTVSRLSDWGYSDRSCRANFYLWRAVPTMSWMLMLSVAIARYLAICQPFYFRYKYKKSKVYITMIVVFFGSLAGAVPFSIWGCHESPCTTVEELKGATRPQEGDYTDSLAYTKLSDNHEVKKEILYMALYRVGVLAVVGICLIVLYGKILHRLWIWREKAKNRPSLEEQLRRLSDGQLAKDLAAGIESEQTGIQGDYGINEVEFWTTFFAKGPSKLRDHLNATLGHANDSNARQEAMYFNVTVLFLLANIPYSVVELFNDLRLDGNPNPRATSVYLVMFVLGFNVNPFIFYVGDMWFRDKFNSICSRIFHCGYDNTYYNLDEDTEVKNTEDGGSFEGERVE